MEESQYNRLVLNKMEWSTSVLKIVKKEVFEHQVIDGVKFSVERGGKVLH
jgi:hypothetical protein